MSTACAGYIEKVEKSETVRYKSGTRYLIITRASGTCGVNCCKPVCVWALKHFKHAYFFSGVLAYVPYVTYKFQCVTSSSNTLQTRSAQA